MTFSLLGAEWDSWVGMALGGSGLLFGILGWVRAGSASEKAGKASEDAQAAETAALGSASTVEQIRKELADRRAVEEEIYAHYPLAPELPDLVITSLGPGEYSLANNGDGRALNVRLESLSGEYSTTPNTRWRTLPPGAQVEFTVQGNTWSDTTFRLHWNQAGTKAEQPLPKTIKLYPRDHNDR